LKMEIRTATESRAKIGEESRFYKSETATEWEMETKRRDEDRCNSVESEKKKGTERKFDGSVWILNCFLSGCY
jgi:hypothetical protein